MITSEQKSELNRALKLFRTIEAVSKIVAESDGLEDHISDSRRFLEAIKADIETVSVDREKARTDVLQLRAEAKDIISDAKAEAARIKSGAEARRDKIIADAEAKAEKLLSDLVSTEKENANLIKVIEEKNREYEALIAKVDAIKAQVKGL